MFTYRLKTVLIMFIAGLVIGIGCTLLFDSCNSHMPRPATVIVSPKEIKKQADLSAEKYQLQINGLQEKNIQLGKDLQATKMLLSQAKKQADKRNTTVKNLIQPKGFSAKELLQSVKRVGDNDSLDVSSDSLREEVKELIRENAVKDSLYEAQINIQDSIIAGKDSVIETQNKGHAELQVLFSQSVQQQELFIKENSQLRKQARRQKVKSTMKTIGLAVLSGLTVKFFTNQ